LDSKLLSERNFHRNGIAQSLFHADVFKILFYNVQGLLSHLAELAAAIRLSELKPSLVCLNETFLDVSVEDVGLEGYDLVARRDRDDGRKGGGVAVYASKAVSSRMVLIEKSVSSERVWLMLHADTGPYLIGVWYRPPNPGEHDSIRSFEEEWQRLSSDVLGTICIGDLNVHHIGWLRHSGRNSSEGEFLRTICDSHGLRQLVTEPTRGDNLLDLALSDLEEVRCKVVGKLADHKGLELALPFTVPRVEIQSRMVWQFKAADWEGLNNALIRQDWSWLTRTDPSTGAERLTACILDLAEFFIPKRLLKERKSTHPWINDRVLELVRCKLAAEGTDEETECRKRCSAGIMEEYGKHVAKERMQLQAMPKGAKAWWSKSKRLMQKKVVVSSVPALKDPDNKWYLMLRTRLICLSIHFPKSTA